MAKRKHRAKQQVQRSHEASQHVHIVTTSSEPVYAGVSVGPENHYDFAPLEARERFTLGFGELRDAWRQFREKRVKA